MLNKLVAHFAEVARPLESAVAFLEGCYKDLPRNYSLSKLHIHTHIYIYVYIYIYINITRAQVCEACFLQNKGLFFGTA